MADLFLKICCTYCQEEVSDISIQCCECEDFDICLECFAAGAEIGPHKKDHAYKIRDTCASKQLLDTVSKWTACEHFMLLNGMEYYRYGSWEKISEHVKTRLPQEVKEEYDRVFVNGTIGIMTWSKPEVSSLRPQYTIDLETAMEAIVSPSIAKLHPMIASIEEMEKLGYSPFRDEYKLEYNSTVEQTIPFLLPYSSDDSNFEKIFKILVLDVIYRRLIDRIRRKRFVRDYQLISKFFKYIDKSNKQLQLDNFDKLNKKFQVFSRFQTSNEYDNLLNSIINLEKLKSRRDQIIEYRKQGFLTRDEVVHYEEHILYNKQEETIANQLCSVTRLNYFASVLKERERRNDFCSNVKKYTELIFSTNVVNDENIKRMSAFELLNNFEVLLCKLFGLKPIQFIKLKLFILKNLKHHQTENIAQNQITAVIVDRTLNDIVTDYLSRTANLKHLNVS